MISVKDDGGTTHVEIQGPIIEIMNELGALMKAVEKDPEVSLAFAFVMRDLMKDKKGEKNEQSSINRKIN